ncbi:MAG: GNAT family N-acetyltransferase [Jatrophihabitans sp.]
MDLLRSHTVRLWALEARASGQFIGFTGLALQTFEAHFTPAVEAFAFGPAHLDDLVSITTAGNEPSRAVMRRLGMSRDPAEDFEYSRLPAGHPLRPHVLHRMSQWLSTDP